jgi:hypothetical protein
MSLLLVLFFPSLASLAFMVVVMTVQTLHLRLPGRSTKAKARLLRFPVRLEDARHLAGARKVDDTKKFRPENI